MLTPEQLLTLDQRRSPTATPMLRTLTQRHHRILQLCASGLYTDKEIAEEVGVTTVNIHDLKSSELGAKALEVYSEKVREELSERIRKFADEAQDFLEDIVTGKYEEASISLRAKLASEALGRAGFGTISKVQSVSTTMKPEDWAELQQRSIDAAKAAGIIVAEPQEGQL